MSYVIPRDYINNFSDAIETISALHKEIFMHSVSKIDFSSEYAGQELLSVLEMTTGSSSKQAAYLAKKFYMGLREKMVEGDGYLGVSDTGHSKEDTSLAAVTIITDSNGEKIGEMRSYKQGTLNPGRLNALTNELYERGLINKACIQMQKRIGYETKRASHRTMYACGARDPNRPRFARIPQRTKSYAEGCPFCQTLASRGFKYLSEKTAGVHVHDGCMCQVIPSWDTSPKAEDYNPRDYDEGYEKFKRGDYSQPDRTIPHRSIQWQIEHGYRDE